MADVLAKAIKYCEDRGRWPSGLQIVEELIEEITRLSRPNFYWNDQDLRHAQSSVGDAIDDPGAGEIVKLRPIHELPTVYILCGKRAFEHEIFDSQEAAEAAGGK